MTGPNAAADRRLDGICWRSGRPPSAIDRIADVAFFFSPTHEPTRNNVVA